MNKFAALEAQLGALTPVHDNTAAEIGALYRKSGESMIESINGRLECGKRLNEVKATLAHGELEPWLQRNKDALGFSRATAFRLMGVAAKVSSTRLTDEGEALKLSRTLWGNEPSPKGRSVVPTGKAKPKTGWVATDTWISPEIDDDSPGDSVAARQAMWKSGLEASMRQAAEIAAEITNHDNWSGYTVDEALVLEALAIADAWQKTALYLQQLRDAQTPTPRAKVHA